MTLSINPSYVTNEVTFASIPPRDFVNSTWSNTAYTRNYPRIRGDSMLGIYGETYQRFNGFGQFRCVGNQNTNLPTYCQLNELTPLFYRPARQIEHETYGVVYRGKDQYYRKPYQYGEPIIS